MTDGQLLFSALYGFFCIFAVGRTALALAASDPLWRPLVWVIAALWTGIYLEINTPFGGSLDGVMLGLIYVVSWVL